jgi:SAM-dependent methyltransferase
MHPTNPTEGIPGKKPELLCRLCRQESLILFCSVHSRNYYRCDTCSIVLLNPASFLPKDQELARYNLHQNSITDLGYRSFLNRIVAPLSAQLLPGARGLDFGCGPFPALAALLSERGFNVATYDPFFFPDRSYLEQQYDFVVSSEVFEHFHEPATEIEALVELVRPGGWLAIMTEVLRDQLFEEWHYVRDPTHTAFYAPQTLEWIAAHWQLELLVPHKNVALFRKAHFNSL